MTIPRPAAAIGSEGFRTGLAGFRETAGDFLNINSHVHAVEPRGGWASDGGVVPAAFIDTDLAERILRAKALWFFTIERGKREKGTLLCLRFDGAWAG